MGSESARRRASNPLDFGDGAAARISLAHAMVLVSLPPLNYGMGGVDVAGASADGGLFI